MKKILRRGVAGFGTKIDSWRVLLGTLNQRLLLACIRGRVALSHVQPIYLFFKCPYLLIRPMPWHLRDPGYWRIILYDSNNWPAQRTWTAEGGKVSHISTTSNYRHFHSEDLIMMLCFSIPFILWNQVTPLTLLANSHVCMVRGRM